MSIEINWDALSGGPDGLVLAESIRAFIHERFQQITLPRFIRSVNVHAFEFGTVPPELELKDVCDPLPDFYEDEEDADTPDTQDNESYSATTKTNSVDPERAVEKFSQAHALRQRERIEASRPHRPSVDTNYSNNTFMRMAVGASNPFLSRSSTPGIPGGTSNMGYFHLPLSAGISGAATPLATAVGAQFAAGWPEHFSSSAQIHDHDDDDDSPPKSREASFTTQSQRLNGVSGNKQDDLSTKSEDARDKSVEDVQIVMHLKYSGDVKLSLTAEILVDYPMPSFVGIPLKLTVTGLTFDGVAILAYIKSKAHFCFVTPEDADALIGRSPDAETDGRSTNARQHPEKHVGGLFEDIKVESEIGQKTNGKQMLKNVGKVEKFVLEQVRRTFESEFVYPSFWTFLV